MGLDHRGSFRIPWKPPGSQSTGFPEPYVSSMHQGMSRGFSDSRDIAHLEWRLQRIEKENEMLFSENRKLQSNYSAALDQLANQLIKALVQQQITNDQLTFSGTQGEQRNTSYQIESRTGRGILKPSGPSPAGSPAIFAGRLGTLNRFTTPINLIKISKQFFDIIIFVHVWIYWKKKTI